jgi:3-vinyl bacteriochlorophyllide hydratase
MTTSLPRRKSGGPLYSEAERKRRDQSPWTLVQGILAPLQFAVFLVSVALVLYALFTRQGEYAAAVSVVVKTFVLYTIMVTGSLWEKDVYGQYLFAPAFFWEDAVSFVVIALHTAYIAALMTGWLTTQQQLVLALSAYAAYVINASQFLLKLRSARLQQRNAAIGNLEAAR